MVPRISPKRALPPLVSAFVGKHGLLAKTPFVPPMRTSMAQLPSPEPHAQSVAIEPFAQEKSKKAPSEPIDELEAREPMLLDSATRSSIVMAPPTSMSSTPPPTAPSMSSSARMAEAQALATAMVERASFWGDGTRGLARLRFGNNARSGLSGATVVLEHDGDKIALRIEDGEDASATAKLVERLRAHGLEVDD